MLRLVVVILPASGRMINSVGYSKVGLGIYGAYGCLVEIMDQ
jgi:hypothetical protein